MHRLSVHTDNFALQAGCFLYYSGDMNPEGVSIAERLKQRYQDKVNFWRMDKVSYENSISNEDISSRLGKLDAIKSIELKGTIERMKEKKRLAIKRGLLQSLLAIYWKQRTVANFLQEKVRGKGSAL